ncbi:MAG TPA: GGDEF domain-containing protein [Sedimenticola sp.]|nr:GGDEF domain-containing protein [Sedimenticola sp.]
MYSQSQSISGSPKTVVTHPAHPTLNPESKHRFAAKVLALTGILQTTLEIDELISLFARELSHFIEFDGLRYACQEQDIAIEQGEQSTHSCRYQLIVSGEELGELHLYRRERFQESELEMVENLLAALLYPLRNTLLYYQAVQSARLDPLTGIRNRSTLNSSLSREMELARRQGNPLSVILVDIDHFKRVNDQCGHLYGDQALRAVAQCIQGTIRESDMLFRYGGEEFLILLSGTGPRGAALLAERIRQQVASLTPRPERQMQLTVSLGVTSLHARESGKQLFERVDRALYRAKQAGRNQVILEP